MPKPPLPPPPPLLPNTPCPTTAGGDGLTTGARRGGPGRPTGPHAAEEAALPRPRPLSVARVDSSTAALGDVPLGPLPPDCVAPRHKVPADRVGEFRAPGAVRARPSGPPAGAAARWCCGTQSGVGEGGGAPAEGCIGRGAGTPRVTCRRVAVSLRGPGQSPVPSLRMLRRVAAFQRPLRPVFLLVPLPRLRGPVVGSALEVVWMGGFTPPLPAPGPPAYAQPLSP